MGYIQDIHIQGLKYFQRISLTVGFGHNSNIYNLTTNQTWSMELTILIKSLDQHLLD